MEGFELIPQVVEKGGPLAAVAVTIWGLFAIIKHFGWPHASASPDTAAEAISSLAKTVDSLRTEVAQMHSENERRMEILSRDVALVYNDTQVIRDRQR